MIFRGVRNKPPKFSPPFLPNADFSIKSDTDDRAKAAKAKESMWKKVTGGIGDVVSSMGDKLYGSPAKQNSGYPSPWDLPEVSKRDVAMELQRVRGDEAGAPRGLKRPASPRKPSSPNKPASPRKKVASPRKIAQRDVGDEDVTDDDGTFMMDFGDGDGDLMMSGGL
jgi:hypothetical protein